MNVSVQAASGFVYVCSGLIEGEGEAGHELCDLLGLLLILLAGLLKGVFGIQDAGAAEQEEGAFLGVHLFDFDALGEGAGDLGAGGDEDVAPGFAGEELFDEVEVVGVVEDEEPALVLLQPAFAGVEDDGLVLLVAFGQLE